jgi:hypothetical protein
MILKASTQKSSITRYQSAGNNITRISGENFSLKSELNRFIAVDPFVGVR